MQDTIFFLPVTADYVAYVLEKERPDGILLTFGGQSALNVGIQLDKMGILERLGVQVLGTPIRTLEVSEDRDLFVQALNGELQGFLPTCRQISRDRHSRCPFGRGIIHPGCPRCRCSDRIPHHCPISLFAWRSWFRFRSRRGRVEELECQVSQSESPDLGREELEGLEGGRVRSCSRRCRCECERAQFQACINSSLDMSRSIRTRSFAVTWRTLIPSEHTPVTRSSLPPRKP
jgi:hypothetical protein